MTIRQEREAEIAEAEYSNGYQEGFAEAREKARQAFALYISQQPWPYHFGSRTYHLVNVELLDDILDSIAP